MSTYFEGKSDAEIAALPEDAIALIVDTECAKQGVPLFLEPLNPPERKVAFDLRLFSVGDFIVSTQEEVDTIFTALRSVRLWNKTWAWNRKGQPEVYEPNQPAPEKGNLIETYKPETRQRIALDLEQYAFAQEAYEAAKKRNQDALDQREAIVNAVYREIWGAQNRERERERVKRLFSRYLEIAKGDKETARKFLILAEKLPEDWHPGDVTPQPQEQPVESDVAF